MVCWEALQCFCGWKRYRNFRGGGKERGEQYFKTVHSVQHKRFCACVFVFFTLLTSTENATSVDFNNTG